ncbi:hypothetical protein [uncultured Methylobacterium sp.]|uniref:hypothetical protein n=1 Tax=uncultured Methylobacterium sp. TaxID=157278 RepID=UPI0035CB8596
MTVTVDPVLPAAVRANLGEAAAQATALCADVRMQDWDAATIAFRAFDAATAAACAAAESTERDAA